MACPCGRGTDYESCCEPIHKGALAPTAESLMRARYSAYAKGNIDFLQATHRPPSGEEIDREATERWSKESEWLGLEIVGTERGSEADDEGVVEFIARWRAGGHDLRHHERSIFKKIEGNWLYVDGKEVKPPPAKSTKVGRNDVCPCGSGKKYKRCHGAA